MVQLKIIKRAQASLLLKLDRVKPHGLVVERSITIIAVFNNFFFPLCELERKVDKGFLLSTLFSKMNKPWHSRMKKVTVVDLYTTHIAYSLFPGVQLSER